MPTEIFFKEILAKKDMYIRPNYLFSLNHKTSIEFNEILNSIDEKTRRLDYFIFSFGICSTQNLAFSC